MDDAQPLVEADSAQQGTHHHRGPRFGVRPVAHGCLQPLGNVPQAFHRDTVADRVERGRQIAFDTVT